MLLCFDANGGVFELLLTDQDAIISDALNHASIIDGVRLCKAKRYRYANADMADLERCLQESQEQSVSVSSLRMVCSLWTVTLLQLTRFATRWEV